MKVFSLLSCFTILLLISCTQEVTDTMDKGSQAEKGAIGEYFEDDLPVILKFVNEMPDQEIRDRLPQLTVVSWKYDGTENNGMPPGDINERMLKLEHALDDALETERSFTHGLQPNRE